MFSVTKNGKPLEKEKYTWDEETRTFSTMENNLVLDFREYDNCTFNTGDNCTFDTGGDCTFNTGWNCTFNTGGDCTFKTGWNCTFNTGDNCTFNTGDNCTFDTGYNCTFNTGFDCTFKTGWNCTFDTGDNCTFDTGYNCTFNTGFDCTFKTGYACTFKTGYGCTFDTGYNCTFKTGSGCTFKTGYACTFKTGYGCTFDTGYNCTFKTGSGCTFKTGYACTFKTGRNGVIVRRDVFEIIQPKENEIIKLCPYQISGYISKRENEDAFYMDMPDGTRQEHIIADSILSKVISKKTINSLTIYKVINHKKTKQSFLVFDGENYSHGDTLEDAKESLIYKISNRDTSEFEKYSPDDELDKATLIKMYRAITGACEAGTRYFCENNVLPDKCTIRKAIELTQGQYNADKFKEFFNKNEVESA